MRKCLTCCIPFSTDSLCCPVCGHEPVMLDGLLAYAPEISRQGEGFKVEYFQELFRLEARHFWFRARNKLITWALKKYSPEFCTFLEIGCGTGYVLSGIVELFPHAKLQGAELFLAGLACAHARLPAVHLIQMDARHIPYYDEFDVIGAFDVLEHIEDDLQVLIQMRDALKANGIVLLTVPQHQWLWSSLDDFACHVRRYSAQELHSKVSEAGFEILRSTSFVSCLLPFMWLSRLIIKKSTTQIDALTELKISPLLNQLFERVMSLDIQAVQWGINLPWGGSRLIVARKK